MLIVIGTIWLLGGFDPEPRPTIASGDCTWKLLDPATDPAIVDTGHPPTTRRTPRRPRNYDDPDNAG